MSHVLQVLSRGPGHAPARDSPTAGQPTAPGRTA
jgi:hypothetical protein